jgi:hypothetical protein
MSLMSIPGVHYECDFCIDGFLPSGQHPELGPIYVFCPFCLFNEAIPSCPDCANTACFPASPSCRHCLLNELAESGLTAAICPTCAGVTYTCALPDPREDTQ